MFWIPVQGTDGWPEHPEGEWWFAGDPLAPPSAFVQFLADHDWHMWNPADPFVWSTDVNGVAIGNVGKLLGFGNNDWRAGGKALRWYLEDVPAGARNLIAHSHGLQVVLEGLADSTKPIQMIDSLITVGSPIRADMTLAASAARPRIGFWLHIHAALDVWQRAGQLLTGHVEADITGRWPRGYPQPDRVITIPGAGAAVHGELLRDPGFFSWWIDRGWLHAVEARQCA